jgi:uncharacterized protein (TIGR03086 family)
MTTAHSDATRLATPPLELLERALDQTGQIVARIQPQQAGMPTPCEDWDVRALVNHTVYDLQTFTGMVTGAERGAPGADLIGEDWSSAYAGASESLLRAWRRRGLEGTLKLGLGDMPATWAVGQHIADVAVHGWDLAKATGQPTELDSEIGKFSLEWARENLKPQLRGQAFGPEVEVPESAPVYDRLAGYFGRRPG